MTSPKVPDGRTQNGAVIRQNENLSRPLSRSPHPYRRRSNSLWATCDSLRRINAAKSAELPPRSSLSDSSESGTEADDERGGSYLKVLPAPPLRGRKGLRGATTEKRTPAVSPLPTPPLAEEVAISYFTHVSPPAKRPVSADQGKQHIREKYTKRKRAEITRRGLETLLLFSVGFVTYQQAYNAAILQRWPKEIFTFLLVVISLYLAYPLRTSWTYFRLWRTPVYAVQRGFHVPSKFDPGALLYPVFVPPFVAASLVYQIPDLMLPNMVLGLSSLPSKLIPCSRYAGLSDVVHWAVSMSPLAAFKLAQRFPADLPPGLTYIDQGPHSMEILTLLHPLHNALLPTLDFLVTTSLDPAELQLLTVALINLFIFAMSPQAQILKSLLWLGGIALFVCCRTVLAWEVTLARIPNWKFRQTRDTQKSAWKSLDINLRRQLAFLVTSRSPKTYVVDSDSDEDSSLKPLQKLRKSPTLDVHRLTTATANGEPRSAVEVSNVVWSDHKPKPTIRRSTFSAEDGSRNSMQTTRGGRLRRSMTPTSSAFLRLTSSQARMRKWMYAIYTYLIVLSVVLLPIRAYVCRYALSGSEPFGWALGYLFGNISGFRFQVVYHGVERWIQLPVLESPSTPLEGLLRVEYTRQVRLGPANTRLAICAYCVTVLLTGIMCVLHLTSAVEVDTRRKVFHGIMVVMLLPTIFVDPCFIALALALILAIFLLLDLFRASQLPPISRPLTNFLAPYVDGRDHRGPIIVSHIFLLIGCAVPLWLSLAGLPRAGSNPWHGWEVNGRDLSMVSGVICVGMGDAAASLIGRRYGRTKWFWGGGKSLEGSVAFTVAVTVGLMISYAWLIFGGWKQAGEVAWLKLMSKAIWAAAGASMTETLCTSANDNVIVPLALWLLVRGLDM